MKVKNTNSKKFIVMAWIKFLLLIGIIVVIPAYIWFYNQQIITNMSSLENVEAYFKKEYYATALTFVGAQVVQIVICIIPGQWLQIASAYLLGFWEAYLLSIIGVAIGTSVSYYLAKILGHDAMHTIFGEEKISNMIKHLNSKRAIIIMFVIFLIPGVPKDLLSYAAGLSEMKLKTFMIISLIGRTPAMMGSLFIGMFLQYKSYTGAIIVGVLAVIAFILGVIFRKRLNLWFDKAYIKITR